ncbi:MAG: hypothetical protein QXQ02_03665 [Halobacteria archaeon]
MKRDELKKLIDKPLEVKEAEQFKEIVYVRCIYNQMLNAHRNLPETYKIKMGAIWSDSVSRNLKDAESEDTINQAIERSKLAKEMIKRRVEVQSKIYIIPQNLPNGEVHAWKVYVEFSFPVEALVAFWGSRYKQKVYLSTVDAQRQPAEPPDRLLDNTTPTGWLGMAVEDDTIITVY